MDRSGIGNGENTELQPPPIPIHIHNPRGRINRLKMHILAFSTCFSVAVLILYLLLLILHLMVIGYWAKLYHSLNEAMPKTFAWEVLIRLLGATYNDCKDRTGSEMIRLVEPEACSYQCSAPVIPVFALFLLVGSALSSMFYYLEKFFLNLSSNIALQAIYMFGCLKLAFFVGIILSICLAFAPTEDPAFKLGQIMKEEMNFSKDPSHISPRWHLSQKSSQCCGVHYFTDWDFEVFKTDGHPRYPRSCCDSTKSLCKTYPNRTMVWTNGCFEKQYDIIREYTMSTLYLTFVGFLSVMLMAILVIIRHTIFQGNGNCKITFTSQSLTPTPTANQDNPVITNHNNQNLPVLLQSPISSTRRSPSVPGNELEQAIELGHIGSGDCSQDLPNNKQSVPNLGKVELNKYHKKCNLFTISRHTDLNVHLNSWGVQCKVSSSSIVKTHVLKKETVV